MFLLVDLVVLGLRDLGTKGLGDRVCQFRAQALGSLLS